MLGALPNEIVHLICGLLVPCEPGDQRTWSQPMDNSTLASLRLANHTFENIASIYFFRSIKTEINQIGVERLEFIASSRYAQRVQSICIGASEEFCHFRTHQVYDLATRMKACTQGLRALTNLSFSMTRLSADPHAAQLEGPQIKCLVVFRDVILLSDLPRLSGLLVQIPEGGTSEYFIWTLMCQDYADEWALKSQQLKTFALWHDNRARTSASGGLWLNETNRLMHDCTQMTQLSLRYGSMFTGIDDDDEYRVVPNLATLRILQLYGMEIEAKPLGIFIRAHSSTLEQVELEKVTCSEGSWKEVFHALRICEKLFYVRVCTLARGSDAFAEDYELDSQDTKLKYMDDSQCLTRLCNGTEFAALHSLLAVVEKNRDRMGYPPDPRSVEFMRVQAGLRKVFLRLQADMRELESLQPDFDDSRRGADEEMLAGCAEWLSRRTGGND